MWVGCKPTALTSGTQVTVLSSEPMDCEELGEVVGFGGGPQGGYVKEKVLLESAVNKARNQAAEMGATHVVLGDPEVVHGKAEAAVTDMQPDLAHGTGSSSTATVRGVAYKCAPGQEPPMVAEALPEVDNPAASISMAPLGTIQHITVYQKVPATAEAAASEVEVLRIDDPSKIDALTESLNDLALDPIKYIPTHRVEFVGELGSQSLLYGFGYLKYAGKTYRLTTGTFERTLELVEPVSSEVSPGPAVESEP